MKTLRLNSALIYTDLVAALTTCIDRLADQYYREVTAAMRTEAGRNDVAVEKLDEADKGLLVRRIIAGSHAVLDSFGSGEAMDTNNPAWEAYANDESYNPLRSKNPAATIVGRPEGDYIDFFGNPQHSSGRLAGVPLVGFLDSPIKNITPSRAFQKAFEDAEKWFKSDGYALETIEYATTEFWASVRANSGRYFKFG